MEHALRQADNSQKTTKRKFVFVAILIGMFMAAIEGTIVATAMPTIVADLGGFSLYSWVFSIYLLMQAITIPIYGKLADLFGRNPVYIIGVIVFLAGSILCGVATTMPAMILFRLIQGIGAGAVQPIATTIVGDIYSIKERAKIQGYLASVWGISAIIGPALGGLFVDYFDWEWVFWINIPFGIISLIGIIFYLHENVEKKKHSIDYLGSGLLLISVSALMLALIQGGVGWSWSSLPSLSLFALFILSLVLFLLQEKRAKEPLMPLNLWKNRIISASNLGALTTGMIMIPVISFVPTYVQGVMEESATVAGFALAMMSIGWPVSSTIAGKILIKLGSLKTALIGGVGLIIGSIILVASQPSFGPFFVGAGSFFIGVGMGFTTTTFVVSIQSSVEWNVRGVATASNMFMRMLGNSIGIALMGGILNTRLSAYLAEHSGSFDEKIDLDVTNTMLDPAKRSALPPDTVQLLETGLSVSLHTVFWGLVILAILSFVLILFLPNEIRTANKKA